MSDPTSVADPPRMRIAIVATHPIQYYSPWFAEIARQIDLTVYYAFRQTPQGQAAAGFSTAFDWDVPLLDGYRHVFLRNVALNPSVGHFTGCNTPEVTSLVRTGGYDSLVMIGWNRLTFIQAWRGAAKAQIPVLVRLDNQLGSARAAWKRLLKRGLYAGVLPRAADYLSPGKRSDAYLAYYGVPAERIHRVPHMVDVQRFADGAKAARADGRADALRRANGADREAIVFLQVGKLIAKKRPLTTVEALARLESAVRERIQVWFVGDGPLEGALAERARQEDLPIRRLGFVNQARLPEIYAAADALLLPSTAEETWGLVVNEAQACGLPAIVSEEAGCSPDLITDGKTGWTFRSGSAEELACLLGLAARAVRDLPRDDIVHLANNSSYRAGTEGLLKAIVGAKLRRARKMDHELRG